jgi:hypothetical protein
MNDFDTNLLKMAVAELYFLLGMQAAREMYGKSYFSLGVAEKATLDGVVWQNVSGNFQQLQPDFAMFQTAQKPVGFQTPSGTKAESPKSEAS